MGIIRFPKEGRRAEGWATAKKEVPVATLEQLKVIEGWWSPSEAGRVLETSGQWVTHLARTGQVTGIKTSLGWLVDHEGIEALAKEKKRKQKLADKSLRKRRELQPA